MNKNIENFDTIYDSDISDHSSDLNSTPYNNPYIDKISLLEIKLYDENIKGWTLTYFDKDFTFIPKNIYEILKIECKKALNPLLDHGKFNECWSGFYGGVGHPDQNIYMYENEEDIDFTVYIEFCGNWFKFYISDINKKNADKFSENSEYMFIIEHIKQNINDLWNTSLRDVAISENVKIIN